MDARCEHILVFESGTNYVGRCDQLSAPDLEAFDDSAVEVVAQTARRRMGPEAWRWLETSLGYVSEGGKALNPGLRLATDWAVRFEKGKWQGETAINVSWSAYHHIFTIPSPGH